jgi:hypothetical protein
MTAPKGWSVDLADPSVGLYGDVWVHEECDLASTEEEYEVTETYEQDDQGNGVVHVFLTLTCPCGASTTVQAQSEFYDKPR